MIPESETVILDQPEPGLPGASCVCPEPAAIIQQWEEQLRKLARKKRDENLARRRTYLELTKKAWNQAYESGRLIMEQELIQNYINYHYWYWY